MTTLFERDLDERGLLTITPREAQALADPLRAEILRLLSHEPMSISEIEEEVRRMGYDKATTTIRHHVDKLKEEGLIELVRGESRRGAVLKYYSANRRMLTQDLPQEFEDSLAKISRRVKPEMDSVVAEILSEYGSEIREKAKDIRPCPHCETHHFVEYVVAEVVNRALAESFADEEVKDSILDSQE